MKIPMYVSGGSNYTYDKRGPFETLLKRYETWPVTVWEIRDTDPDNKFLKSKVGDKGEARSGHKASPGHKGPVGKNMAGATTSIFPPRVAASIIKLFCPVEAQVFDPFAGGGCLAVVAAMLGRPYTGIELREEEVQNIRKNCGGLGLTDLVTIKKGDAREPNGLGDESFDFCYTCPPYWTLEQYEGGDADMSMIENYDDFLTEMSKVVAETFRVLKPGSRLCWVLGLHRKRDEGNVLAPLNHDIARLHVDQGFDFLEEVVIHRNNPIALRRAGEFEKGDRLLIRQHEYCLVFKRR